MIRNRYVLAIDLPLIGLCAFAAFAMRFDWRFYEHRAEFLPYTALALVVKPLIYFAFGLYQRVWRYAGLRDMMAVATGVSAASIVMGIIVALALMLDPAMEFSRVVILADWLLSLATTGGARISLRLLSERMEGESDGREQKRLLVVGAGDAGAMVVREIQRNPALGLAVVGFLDDEPAKHRKWIHGVQVLGSLSSLKKVLATTPVDEVMIAMPSASGAVIRVIADACREVGVVSRTVPSVFELMDGQVSVSRVRQIEITDLLRRKPIGGEPNANLHIGGKAVLVTGGGGSIGQELCRQIAKAGPSSLVLLGHGENSLFEAHVQLREQFPDVRIEVVVADVRDRSRLHAVIRRRPPDVIFHAAAHKHVPLMQDNAEEAVSNNVLGTRNVVDAAVTSGVERLVMISTDKAVAPHSIMGASKRLAEMIVRDAASRHGRRYCVVRFGNVLGSRGSVVPFFRRQIEQGGPVTVTHPDMKRYFMTIAEAVHLVLQAASLARAGELFVLDMGEPVRIVDLARDMVKLVAHRRDDIDIVFTGLRPGEKLEETLWEPEAHVERTSHPKVWRVHEPQVCFGSQLQEAVERLHGAAQVGDILGIEAEFARVIPSYVPHAVAAWDRA